MESEVTVSPERAWTFFTNDHCMLRMKNRYVEYMKLTSTSSVKDQ